MSETLGSSVRTRGRATGTGSFSIYGTANGGNIGILSINRALEWKPLLQTTASEISPALSPDGGWLAYASNQSGRFEVYVERFPDLGDAQADFADGGAAPLWAPNGRELFYLRGDAMMGVPIDGESALSVGDPRVAVQGTLFFSTTRWEPAYDINRPTIGF